MGASQPETGGSHRSDAAQKYPTLTPPDVAALPGGRRNTPAAAPADIAALASKRIGRQLEGGLR